MEKFIETTQNVLISHNLWVCQKYKEQIGFSIENLQIVYFKLQLLILFRSQVALFIESNAACWHQQNYNRGDPQGHCCPLKHQLDYLMSLSTVLHGVPSGVMVSSLCMRQGKLFRLFKIMMAVILKSPLAGSLFHFTVHIWTVATGSHQ